MGGLGKVANNNLTNGIGLTGQNEREIVRVCGKESEGTGADSRGPRSPHCVPGWGGFCAQAPIPAVPGSWC